MYTLVGSVRKWQVTDVSFGRGARGDDAVADYIP
jgi:hypothetical protein